MKPHILFVLDYFTPHRGGSETVFQNIISRLHAKGYPLTILTSRYETSLPSYENQDGIHIYRIGTSRLGFMCRAYFEGRRILRQEKNISLIHTSTYGGAIPASLLGVFYRKKVLLTVHEIFGKLRYLYKGRWGGILYRLLEWCIFVLPYAAYHCVSRYTFNALRIVYGIPDAKLHMIYNGVDTAFWDPKKVSEAERHQRRVDHGWEDRFVVAYYGHAGKSKGLDYLLQAIPQVLTQEKDIIFACNLIDSRRTHDTIQQLHRVAHQLHLQKRIQLFNGFDQETLRTFIASTDLVVAPSLAEGFGSVHTEVAAMGKSLLTTCIGPLPEVVRGNVLMVNPSSSSEIAQGIIDFAHNNVHHHLPPKEFSRDHTTQEIETLYQKMHP